MKKIIAIIFVLTIIGCKDTVKTKTCFGGQIVNPKSNEVVLYKDGKPIDTAKLDQHNRFMFNCKNLKSGLYYFYHQPEHQYFILEDGDSLLVRLNTFDFDESLVFTGKGARKNNVLINQFLQDEKDKKIIKEQYISLPPKQFRAKIDSMQAYRDKKLTLFLEHHPKSEFTKKVLNAHMNLNLYRYCEIYPYLHNKYFSKQKINLDDLDKNFYSYRKLIDVNDGDLDHFYPLIHYIKLYCAGEAYKHVIKEHPNYSFLEATSCFEYHTYKLLAIDTEVVQKEIRDNVYRDEAFIYILDDKRDASRDEEYITTFKKFTGNNSYLPEIEEVFANIQNLKKGNKLKSVKFINEEGNSENINEINNDQLTVYYFWAMNQKNHFINILKRVNELKSDFPKVHFVGVNKDLSQTDWLSTIKKYHLNSDNQFRIKNFDSVSKKLVLSKMNKVIIVNSEGVIVDAFADIYDNSTLETILASYKGSAKSQDSIANSVK